MDARISRPSEASLGFLAAGYPVAHGEESQALALWACSRGDQQSQIRLVVTEAGDYDVLRGLRMPAVNTGQQSAPDAGGEGLKETVTQ